MHVCTCPTTMDNPPRGRVGARMLGVLGRRCSVQYFLLVGIVQYEIHVIETVLYSCDNFVKLAEIVRMKHECKES